MVKIFKIEFYLIFQSIIIFLKQIDFSNSSCSKEIPIYKDGKCQSIYCTAKDFENKICLIENDTIKTQWLNNFINFNEERYRFTNMIISSKGELILESSPEDTNGKRLFFRLTKDGRSYYKNEYNEEIMTKTIIIFDGDDPAIRYESQFFPIRIQNNDENKEFLVSISLYYGFMEIYDLDNNNITFSKISVWDFGGYIIYSRKGSVIELNNKEYLYFFLAQSYNDWKYYAVLKKFVFFDNNINKENFNESSLIEDKAKINTRFSRVVSAFKTESNKIVLFYVTNNVQFKVEIYDENFDYKYDKVLEFLNNFNDENSLFFKCILFKESIGIFAYYLDGNFHYPKILIENITENLTENKFSIQMSDYEYEYNNEPLLNDIIKINDKRFSFISTSPNRTILYVILFDLYNNDENIKLRFYKIDIFKLYSYKIFQDLSAILYNTYLTISLSVCITDKCDEKTDSFFTSLLFFSYINGSDYNINISEYFSNQDENNNDDMFLNFPKKSKIDNNIFGYQIEQKIKIISIPDEINLYLIINDNTKTPINVGEEYSSDIKLLISPKSDVIKNFSIYSIEYQYQYIEPDYDTFNQYPDKICDIGENLVDQKEEFNSDIKTYYGRTLKIEFKLCNEKCKTCKSIGKSDTQTKCEECKDNFKYYTDGNTNSYTCFPVEDDCPEDSPFLHNDNLLKCLNTCDFDDIKNDRCILDNTSVESLKKVKTIIADIIANNYNNEDIILKTDEDITFHLSNTNNEKENLNNKGSYNLSILDLGECENKLKEANDLSDDVSLILLKVESFYENTTIKNVQYEIYNPKTKEKITDMSPCDDEKIYIYVPTNLDNNTYNLYEELKIQGYDIFNPNDNFYNNLCTKYTTDNDTDLTLNDRKSLFYNESQIFCQENCEYQSIDLETLHAVCECSAISNTEIDFEVQQFSGFEIITSFYEVIKFSNFLVLKCYELVFSSAGIKNNFGSIFMIIFIIILLINMIIFLFRGMNKIKDQMSKMIYCSMNNLNTLPSNEIKDESFFKLKKKIFPQNPKKRKKKRRFKRIKKNNIQNGKILNTYSKKKFKSINILGEKIGNTYDYGIDGKKSSIHKFLKKKKCKKNGSILVFKTRNEKVDYKKYSEFELDDLEYLEAIKYDKRTFFEFFLCLVKREHLICFTFIYCKDLNLLCIKLSLFVFSISLDFATNVLFFNDDSMHKIYLDYGKYNFISQIPQIVYSTCISEAFDVFLKFLSLSEKEIYETKKFINMEKTLEEVQRLIRRLKIKFFFFFFICFALMSFFWYFIACFCSVYENTQSYLIKDSLTSLLISLLYPFVLYLIPATLRIVSLRSKEKDKRFLYKISNIFPLF